MIWRCPAWAWRGFRLLSCGGRCRWIRGTSPCPQRCFAVANPIILTRVPLRSVHDLECCHACKKKLAHRSLAAVEQHADLLCNLPPCHKCNERLHHCMPLLLERELRKSNRATARAHEGFPRETGGLSPKSHLTKLGITIFNLCLTSAGSVAWPWKIRTRLSTLNKDGSVSIGGCLGSHL